MRNRIMIAVVALCMLSFVGGMCISESQAAGGTAVIGKANIKAGTQIGGMAEVADGQYTSFIFIAFEDTVVYITEKVDPVEGVHPGGYLADAAGFPHACPTHGKEIMTGGMLGIPVSQLEAEPGKIEIILFEEVLPNN